MSIITLTTDYGLKDHFVGALKGKILTKLKDATIVDISHNIDPFNTFEASYIINAAYNSFPKKTVHLIGVDIEKNKENKHIAILWEGHYFIAADNGILSMITYKIAPQQIVEITENKNLEQNNTDIDSFVSVACHLANGGLLQDIGSEITNMKEVTNLKALVSDDLATLKGIVIYVDNFGNVVTNITKTQFEEVGKSRNFEIILKTKNITTILPNYSAIATSDKYPIKNYEGLKLALFNEAGFLEIAIFRSNPNTVGSASSLLGLHYRDTITIKFN